MSIIKPLVCYYSALDPAIQIYNQPVPNDNPSSTLTAGLYYISVPLYNDLNQQIGILKTDASAVDATNNSQYQNRVWTAFFYNYGSVSFPVAYEISPTSPSLFAPGTLFKMPILYCSGNDIYNLKGEVEFMCYGNDVVSRSITIKFANPN